MCVYNIMPITDVTKQDTKYGNVEPKSLPVHRDRNTTYIKVRGERLLNFKVYACCMIFYFITSLLEVMSEFKQGGIFIYDEARNGEADAA